MSFRQDRRAVNESGIFGLWWNWTVAFGFVILPVVLTWFVSRLWLPLVVFGMHLLLLSRIRRNRTQSQPVCDLILMVCSHVLLWCAIIMVAINLLHTQWFDVWSHLEGVPVNKQIPYISILIIAPVTLVVSVVVKLSGESRSFCKDCHFRRGDVQERGFLGTLFTRETNYQLNLLMSISGGITLMTWLYYYFYYINVNINTPDQFVFRWVPVLIYSLSIGYLGMRYVSLWGYYRKVVESNRELHGDSTLVRFLIMCGDYIFLKDCGRLTSSSVEADSDDSEYDTPARVYVPHCKKISDNDARSYFERLSGVGESEVRFMYASPDFMTDCNIIHYACFLDNVDVMGRSLLHGEWFTLDQIRRMGRDGQVSGLLSAEIMRLYRISMAWKTYDINGKRLYKIKNYTPTFRLRDFRKWNVDLNDARWLFVANNNEDRPFFHIKRLWRKYVNGIGR